MVPSKGREVEFKVVKLLSEGLESGVLRQDTRVYFKSTPLQRSDE
jgi:hypothetical protein